MKILNYFKLFITTLFYLFILTSCSTHTSETEKSILQQIASSYPGSRVSVSNNYTFGNTKSKNYAVEIVFQNNQWISPIEVNNIASLSAFTIFKELKNKLQSENFTGLSFKIVINKTNYKQTFDLKDLFKVDRSIIKIKDFLIGVQKLDSNLIVQNLSEVVPSGLLLNGLREVDKKYGVPQEANLLGFTMNNNEEIVFHCFLKRRDMNNKIDIKFDTIKNKIFRIDF